MSRTPDRKWKRFCEYCDKVFPIEHRSNKKKYCSDECRSKNLKILRKQKPYPLKGIIKTPRQERVCPNCSVIFLMPPWDDQKYCSHKCFSIVNAKRERTPETRAKMSASSKAAGVFKRLRQNPEYLKKFFAGKRKTPTKPEIQMTKLLDRLYPGEYRYTGLGDFIVDGLNPDFVNVNGQKKLIEVFGVAYHDPEKAFKKVPYRSTSQGRKEAFAKFGYETLIVWDSEMKDMAAVEKRVRRFHIL